MEEKKLTLEYPLKAKSRSIVWSMIGDAAGLSKWLADQVSEDNGKITFTWGQPWTERDTKVSEVIEREKNQYIRLKWDYFEDEDSFWEMRIVDNELEDGLNLHITDYALEDDIDDLHDLWDQNMERLHRVSGL
jgi:uncharacterized protein YndB with AHSA1/START domain